MYRRAAPAANKGPFTVIVAKKDCKLHSTENISNNRAVCGLPTRSHKKDCPTRVGQPLSKNLNYKLVIL